jgi:ketosteroid isomerase-like protein
MKIWMIVAVTLLAAGTTAGTVAQAAKSSNPGAKQLGAQDPFAVLRTQWARNLHDKRIEDSMAAYTADAEFINPDGSRVRGAAELRKLFETVTAAFDSDLTFDSKRVAVAGDLGYDSGSYHETLKVRATGKLQQANGSYLTVYRRGKDGTWRIEEQVWTGAVSDATTASLAPHPTFPAVARRVADNYRVRHAHLSPKSLCMHRSKWA